MVWVFQGCKDSPSAAVELPPVQRTRTHEERMNQWLGQYNEAKAFVKNGDLVLRQASDIVGGTIRNMNLKDKTYSHAGLVFEENGEWWVYHSIMGDDNPSGEVLRQKLDTFCYPKTIMKAFGIARYEMNEEEIAKVHVVMQEHFKNKMKFDDKFDMNDDSKLYCAEIIANALKSSTNGRIIIPTTQAQNVRIKDPAYKGKFYKELIYYSLDNLYMNPFCKEIARVSYQ